MKARVAVVQRRNGGEQERHQDENERERVRIPERRRIDRLVGRLVDTPAAAFRLAGVVAPDGRGWRGWLHGHTRRVEAPCSVTLLAHGRRRGEPGDLRMRWGSRRAVPPPARMRSRSGPACTSRGAASTRSPMYCISTPSAVRATGCGTATPARERRASIPNSLSGQSRRSTVLPCRVFVAAADGRDHRRHACASRTRAGSPDAHGHIRAALSQASHSATAALRVIPRRFRSPGASCCRRCRRCRARSPRTA